MSSVYGTRGLRKCQHELARNHTRSPELVRGSPGWGTPEQVRESGLGAAGVPNLFGAVRVGVRPNKFGSPSWGRPESRTCSGQSGLGYARTSSGVRVGGGRSPELVRGSPGWGTPEQVRESGLGAAGVPNLFGVVRVGVRPNKFGSPSWGRPESRACSGQSGLGGCRLARRGRRAYPWRCRCVIQA